MHYETSNELDYFLYETLHSQYCACTINYISKFHKFYQNATDICELIEDSDCFKNIIMDADAINFNFKNAYQSLTHIFSKLIEITCELNYGVFWLLMTLIRHIIIKSTLKGFNKDEFVYIIKSITDFADTHLSNFISTNGSYSDISNLTIREPFTPFLSKDLENIQLHVNNVVYHN